MSDTIENTNTWPVDVKYVHDIRKGMFHFLREEVLDGENSYKCEKCNRKTRATKKYSIKTAPNILVIHLKRFDCSFIGKLTHYVAYPELINLKSLMTESESNEKTLRGNVNYKLYGVLVHVGSTSHSGHYYSYVRAPNNIWYKADDQRINAVQANDALRQNAYILFYSRLNEPINNDLIIQRPLSQVNNNENKIKESNNKQEEEAKLNLNNKDDDRILSKKLKKLKKKLKKQQQQNGDSHKLTNDDGKIKKKKKKNKNKFKSTQNEDNELINGESLKRKSSFKDDEQPNKLIKTSDSLNMLKMYSSSPSSVSSDDSILSKKSTKSHTSTSSLSSLSSLSEHNDSHTNSGTNSPLSKIELKPITQQNTETNQNGFKIIETKQPVHNQLNFFAKTNQIKTWSNKESNLFNKKQNGESHKSELDEYNDEFDKPVS